APSADVVRAQRKLRSVALGRGGFHQAVQHGARITGRASDFDAALSQFFAGSSNPVYQLRMTRNNFDLKRNEFLEQYFDVGFGGRRSFDVGPLAGDLVDRKDVSDVVLLVNPHVAARIGGREMNA